MNKKKPKVSDEPTYSYVGIVSDEAGKFLKKIEVEATDRREAITQILKWLYKEGFKTVKGKLCVGDSYNEVVFDGDVKCTDKLYNYLPDDVLERLVKESEGVLGINPQYPAEGYQTVCLKRKNYKKLKKEGKRKVSEVEPQESDRVKFETKSTRGSNREANVWEESTILGNDIYRGPTVIEKSVIRIAKDENKSVLVQGGWTLVDSYVPKITI
ncbi:MAG: hypothetical protein K9M11_01355 [Candidatus Pacebacteria bacterium]|nr:hypothetical protein [Candidatus Paceibacterota bacterium]